MIVALALALVSAAPSQEIERQWVPAIKRFVQAVKMGQEPPRGDFVEYPDPASLTVLQQLSACRSGGYNGSFQRTALVHWFCKNRPNSDELITELEFVGPRISRITLHDVEYDK